MITYSIWYISHFISRYTLKVKRLSPGSETDESLTIVREYDDFEFLHHVLTTNNTVRKLNGM